jgi:tRNA(Arg) A34 adenosine deaminase TadA
MVHSESWCFPAVQFRLPDWICGVLPDPEHVFCSDEEKMMLAIRLARLNIEHQSGGPFGAAVFDATSNRLVAPGVNLVEALALSSAHAEMIAMALAQQLLGVFDLAATTPARYELFSSVEPCSMCMGAILWSGIRRLVCGASDQDARAIGFDEGLKVNDWPLEFQARGIAVRQHLCREHAAAVLIDYRAGGGLIYNPRRSA